MHSQMEKALREDKEFSENLLRNSAVPIYLVEREIAFSGLSDQMLLSRDLCSGIGLLLLSKGTELDAVKIEALKRFHRLDPPKGGVFIFARR